ncbi:MAG: zinc ribbon domain-containing protein [Anaerolineae bacterium]
MPVYEYVCADCNSTFAKLRSMSQSDAPAPCPECGGGHTSRAISLFSAVSRGSNGESRGVNGAGGSCGSCAKTTCAGCSH